MLDVLIDARPLRNNLSGVGQYVLHLALELQGHPDVRTRLMAFDFLGRSNTVLGSADAGGLEGALWRRTLLHRKLFNAAAAYSPAPIASSMMPRNADILHGTYFEKLPTAGRAARVSTIHDVGFLRYPQFFSKQNRQASQRALRQQIAHSDLLLTVSDFTRRELVDLCGVDPDRIRVTPLGPTQKVPPPLDEATRRRPYFLFIGNLEPRKNLARCLEAWDRSGLCHDFELIVVGARLRSQVDQQLPLDRTPGVVPVGYVDAATKWRLLRNATGFLWPSLYEGFGIPVLEAMAAGAPVITSRGSAMEELTGDLAWLVDPQDVDDIADALSGVAHDGVSARVRGERGVARAAQFTWAATAAKTIQAYQEAITLHRGRSRGRRPA